ATRSAPGERLRQCGRRSKKRADCRASTRVCAGRSRLTSSWRVLQSRKIRYFPLSRFPPTSALPTHTKRSRQKRQRTSNGRQREAKTYRAGKHKKNLLAAD